MNRVPSSLLGELIYPDTEQEVWEDINSRFDKDLYNGKVKEIGKECDGLYLLVNQSDEKTIENASFYTQQDDSQTSNSDIKLWHKKLGHGDNKVCKLIKSLYGVKQAPRQWNAKLTEALIWFEFKQCNFDHSFFIKKTKKEINIVFVYVYDMLITGDNLQLIEETKKAL
ncbi:putative disease resistance protein-like [Capsicum annuum]|nr:putative disease resistance protein-like [Capsicum annuum]